MALEWCIEQLLHNNGEHWSCFTFQQQRLNQTPYLEESILIHIYRELLDIISTAHLLRNGAQVTSSKHQGTAHTHELCLAND